MCDIGGMSATKPLLIHGHVVDAAVLASELIRSLRGRRSRAWLSRRLGHRSDVFYRWEAGARVPSAAQMLCCAGVTGRGPGAVLAAFDDRLQDLVDPWAPTEAEVAAVLRCLTAGLPVSDLAAVTGLSRFTVGRILSGQAMARLPKFFLLLHAATGRLLDFLAGLVDPLTLPTVAAAWTEHQALVGLAYRSPQSEAIAAALETVSYRSLPRHCPAWLAGRTGFGEDLIVDVLQLMAVAGVVVWDRDRWAVRPGRRVHTRRDPAAFDQLKSFWMGEALTRAQAGLPTQRAYSVMSIAQRDLERASAVLLNAFHEVRAICAASEGADRVTLVQIQLCPLDGRPVMDSGPQEPGQGGCGRAGVEVWSGRHGPAA
jgi:hypothetical protein